MTNRGGGVGEAAAVVTPIVGVVKALAKAAWGALTRTGGGVGEAAAMDTDIVGASDSRT